MKIFVQEARFERSTNTFFAMNPQYTINWKDQKEECGPAEGGDQTPKWNRAFVFDVGASLDSAGVMTFTFLEDSTLIADCEIDVERLARHEEEEGYLYDVFYEGEKCGEVNIRTVYKKPAMMGMM